MNLPNYLEKLSDDLRLVSMGQFFRRLMKRNRVGPKILAEQLGIPRRSLMNYLANTRSIPIGICKKIITIIVKNDYRKILDQLYKETTFIKSTSSSAERVKLLKHINRDFAYIIGALHDGCVFSNLNKNQFLVQYTQYYNREWLIEIAEILKKNFGIYPKIYQVYLQLSNKYVYEFFSKILGVNKQDEWNSFLEGYNQNLKMYLIAGMFDAEGWCSKNDLRIKFSQKNYEKLLEIKSFLNKKNIQTGEVVDENGSHALYVCGKNCISFYNKIGIFCRNYKKIERLKHLKVVFY